MLHFAGYSELTLIWHHPDDKESQDPPSTARFPSSSCFIVAMFPDTVLKTCNQWITHQWRFHYNINSLAHGKFQRNFRYLIFQIIAVIDGWGISCELALGWMSLNLTDDKSTLVQVMAWCRQATNHYLSQCWPRSLSPYGVTRSQRVKAATKWPLLYRWHFQMHFREWKLLNFK